MTDPRNPTSDDRYVAFDELADLVNTGQLSMLGAKALWYEVACRPPDQSTLFEDSKGVSGPVDSEDVVD